MTPEEGETHVADDGRALPTAHAVEAGLGAYLHHHERKGSAVLATCGAE